MYFIDNGKPSNFSDVITLLDCKSSEIELTNVEKMYFVMNTGPLLNLRHFVSVSNFSRTKNVSEHGLTQWMYFL